MEDRIVFLDIDGTLFDEHQRTNCDIVPVISDLQKSGVHFGLNSNRAWEDVLPIISQFHLDGPFILENGAYYKETVAAEPQMCADIHINIPQIVHQLLTQLVQKNFFGADVQVVDTTHEIILSDDLHTGNHFYMNAFRKFSASIHHRFAGTCSFIIAEKITDEMNTLFEAEKISLRATAHMHGATVTIDVPGINKGTGILFLQKKYPRAQFIAIGDGKGDMAMRPFVSTLYAVSNAVSELKEIADATATSPFTQGVKEILEKNLIKK